MPGEEPTPEETKQLRGELIDKIASLATASFGLVAALAWNSAIQAAFERYFPSDESRIAGRVLYAVVVTAIAVVVTLWIGRVAGRIRAGVGKLPLLRPRRYA